MKTEIANMRISEKIIFFDGICQLCNGWSKFILKVDSKKRFKLSALQSRAGQDFLKNNHLETESFNTVFLLDGDQISTKSNAVLKINAQLPFPWSLARVFYMVPRVVRDMIYDFVARHRYRIFGKLGQCNIPSEEDRDRFLL